MVFQIGYTMHGEIKEKTLVSKRDFRNQITKYIKKGKPYKNKVIKMLALKYLFLYIEFIN